MLNETMIFMNDTITNSGFNPNCINISQCREMCKPIAYSGVWMLFASAISMGVACVFWSYDEWMKNAGIDEHTQRGIMKSGIVLGLSFILLFFIKLKYGNIFD